MDYSWNSSYVYGVDNASGWGPRYFFTYYSQFDKRASAFIAIEVAIFTFIFLVSLVANLSILVCVFKFPDMRTVTNCFVLNLAAADLLFAFTIPAVAYTRIVASWQLGDAACRLIPYIQFVSGIVLLWTLSIISIDRHRCIVIPPYRSKMTPKQAYIYSLLIWISVAIIFIPVTFWFRQIELNPQTKICTLIFPKSKNIQYSIWFTVPVVLFACLLPMILLVFHYQRIFQKILSTKNAWATSCVMVESKGCQRAQVRRQSELSMTEIFVPWPRKFSVQTGASPIRTGSLSQHEEIRLNKHIKVVRVLFLNVVVVLVMWLPITIVMILIYIDGSRDTEDRKFFLRSCHFIVCLIIAYLNALVNPLLYGVLSDSFRACLARIWCLRNAPASCLNVVKEEHNHRQQQQVTLSSVGRANNNNNNSLMKSSRKPSALDSLSENQNDEV